MHYIQEALLEVLKEKTLDRIAVRDVCETANISRQTVYYHYDSLLHVFESWFEASMIERFRAKGTSRNWTAGYNEILHFCREYRDQLLNVYNSSYKEEFMDSIKAFAKELVTEAINGVSGEKHIPLTKVDKHFLMDFYMTVVVGFLEGFITKGMVDDPDYISGALELMIGGSVEEKEKAFITFFKE